MSARTLAGIGASTVIALVFACGDSTSDGDGTTSTTATGATAASGTSGATSGKGSAASTAAVGPTTGSGPTTGTGSGTGGGEPIACPGDKPDETNTGAPPGASLTVVDDDLVIDQDGAVVEDVDVHGFVRIEANDVTLRRAVVRGRATGGNDAVVRIESGTGILIEDVTIDAEDPSVGVDGLWGSDFVGRRLHVKGGVDGMKLGSNATVECSYVHDLDSFDSDPNQGGNPTHNDAIQILSGTAIRLVGNNLVVETDDNAAIQVTQDFGETADLHIEGNWADGGGCTFNFSHKGGPSLDDVVTTGNRFGRGSYFDCPILKSTQTNLTSTGDVWDDDGTDVPIQTHD